MRLLITGASGLLGKALVTRFSASGNSLALLARSARRLESVADMARAGGAETTCLTCDLRTTAQIAPSVDKAATALGGLDAIVHAAGLFGYAALEDADLTHWDRVLDLNLRAAMHLAHAALPHLVASSNPAMLFIGSVSGKDPFATAGAYAASKAGLLAFSNAIFEDVRASGIKVSTITCGQVASRVDVFPLEDKIAIPPADVAEAAAFVLSFPSGSCPTEILLRPQLRLGAARSDDNEQSA